MQVLLDDTPCDLDARTVGEAIDAGAGLAGSRGRLVVEVVVDDVHWTDGDLSSAERLAAGARVVRLVTADPRRLVADALGDADVALAEADRLQQEAARLLQADQHTVALDQLGEAMAIWLAVQEAIVKGARLIGLDLDSIAGDRGAFAVSIARLNDWLVVLRNALADRDVIGLADTLLYEMPAVVSEWRQILQELTRRVADP